MLTDIFDQLFLTTLSPTSAVWEIAGAIALPSLDFKNDYMWIAKNHYIEDLPQLTGLSISTIFQILEDNWNFFDLDMSHYPRPDRWTFAIHIQSRHEVFLKDKVRSRHLYVTYLNSVVCALKSRIAYIKSVKPAEV